jgi:hypothetical protein
MYRSALLELQTATVGTGNNRTPLAQVRLVAQSSKFYQYVGLYNVNAFSNFRENAKFYVFEEFLRNFCNSSNFSIGLAHLLRSYKKFRETFCKANIFAKTLLQLFSRKSVKIGYFQNIFIKNCPFYLHVADNCCLL